jgi:hypothetical protein
MDKQEAQEILDRQLKLYRDKSYDQLSELVDSEHIFIVTGKSGVEYQVEVQAFWDHPKHPFENLRVFLSIDDGKFLSSLKPMTADFIMAADGYFVGE